MTINYEYELNNNGETTSVPLDTKAGLSDTDKINIGLAASVAFLTVGLLVLTGVLVWLTRRLVSYARNLDDVFEYLRIGLAYTFDKTEENRKGLKKDFESLQNERDKRLSKKTKRDEIRLKLQELQEGDNRFRERVREWESDDEEKSI